MIVGLHGRKGSGKDTAVEGYPVAKFAAGFKNMLRTYLFSFPGMTPELCERLVEGDLKEKPSEFFGGRSSRDAQVMLGTEWGRALYPAIWVDLLEARLREHELTTPERPLFVTDVRFPDEAEAIRRQQGIVVEIVRPAKTAQRRPWWAFWRKREHISEQPLSRELVDAVVVNDDTVEVLRERLDLAIIGVLERRLVARHAAS